MLVRDHPYAPASLTPEASPQYLLNRRLGGPNNWSRHFVEEKIRCVYHDSNNSSSSPYPSHCIDYIIFHKYLQLHCCIYRSILAHSQRESRISECFKAQNTLTDCGVCIWPWHLFPMEKADRPFFVTCNPPPTLCRCTAFSPVSNSVEM